jgi:hypothetical protein
MHVIVSFGVHLSGSSASDTLFSSLPNVSSQIVQVGTSIHLSGSSASDTLFLTAKCFMMQVGISIHPIALP